MALLYIAAEASELKAFAGRLTGLRPLKWPLQYAQEGILEGRRIVLAANGAGPKLAGHALEIAIRAITAADLQSSPLEGVVSVGLCGGLEPDLLEGQIVISTEIRGVDSEEIFITCPVDSSEPFRSGLLVSQDRIASTSAEKSRLRERYGAMAVEMEALGIAVRAKRARLPLACIKVVLDRAGESFGIDFNASRSGDGRFLRGKILLKGVAKPSVIPELIRLKRRADFAASALGDFLVSCRINLQSAGVPVDNTTDAG